LSPPRCPVTRKDYLEFDGFVDALPGLRGRCILRARLERPWRLTSTALCDVVVTMGREGAASIFRGRARADSCIVFASLSGSGSFAVDGHRLDSGEFAWMAPGRLSHIVSDRPSNWLRIVIPHGAVASRFASGEDAVALSSLDCNRVLNSRRGILDLVRLARRIFGLDATSGNAPFPPDRAQAIKVELVDAVYRMLVSSMDRRSRGRPVATSMAALDRALALIDTRAGESLKAHDLSRAAGLSERSLRNVFQRYVAMSPHQYVVIARLHAVRAAIHAAQPGDSVTRLCGDFGISDIGRFASQYRLLFGVLPSQDLAIRRLAALARRTPSARHDSLECRPRVFSKQRAIVARHPADIG
jgi:AraC family transcriptional regulator, ethanolamine operon transcriptional activator